MSGRDDREIRELLAELETTLDALRADVDDGGRDRRRGPATPRDLLRVTEEHTIPTLVAALEAAVEALELLRALLRLADPERSASGRPGGPRAVARASDPARSVAERALSDLREALSESDLPDDPRARSLVAEARDLTAEVEARLREAEGGPGGTASGAAPATSDGAVRIEVNADGADEDPPDDPGVDVDAELASIRREVRDDESGRADEGTGGTEAGSAGEGAEAGSETGDEDGTDAEGAGARSGTGADGDGAAVD